MTGFLLGKPAAGQAPSFAHALTVAAGATANSGGSTSLEIATDAAGNSYLTGWFSGTVLFGTYSITSIGGHDLFVAKYDPTGACLWVARAGGPGDDYGSGIGIDGSSSAYVVGSYTGSAAFGATTLAGTGGIEVVVAKLTPAGAWQWAQPAGGAGDDYGQGIAVDASGNAYAAAAFFSRTVQVGTTTLTNTAVVNSFVAKYAPTGALQWVKQAGGSATVYANAVAVDRSGAPYVFGDFSGSTLLGSTALVSAGEQDVFVAKLDPASGAYLWATRAGGSGNEQAPAGTAIVADSSGSAYITGRFTSRDAAFGNLQLQATGSTDLFIARLAPAGTFQWAVQAGGPAADDEGEGLALDGRGFVLATGRFGATAAFGSTTLVSAGSSDVYLGKLNAGSGAWVGAARAGGPQADAGYGVSRDAAGRPYTTGFYSGGSASFGPVALSTISPAQPASFLALDRVVPPSLAIAGDSLVCNGGQVTLTAVTTGAVAGYRWSTGATTAAIVVTQPGTYTLQVTFAGGAVLAANYRVRGLTPPVVTIAGGPGLCPGGATTLLAAAPGARSLRWSTGATTAGITVTQPGTYTVTASYGVGCTATASITVVGNSVAVSGRFQLCPGQSTTLTAAATGTAVASYRWNTGATTPTLTVAQAGTYTATVAFADGCLLTASHRVGPPTATVASVTGDTIMCPGSSLQLTAMNPDALTYRWNTGATTPVITVAAPGTYAVLLTYAGGCTSRDSLAVLPAPAVPAFTLGPDTTLCFEMPLLLRAPALAGSGVSFRWSDGSTAPTLRVQAAGLYSLQLTTHCEARTVSRRVDYASCLFIPNVITPNGDGRNDQFVIKGLTRGAWALALYNRWGREVYATAAYGHDWGAEAPAGVYYYLLWQGPVRYRGTLEVFR
ncbi:gliding motility-associated C-terminal domain-containing protein [Hymenobacter sp. UYCo722]|uniref:T9SS type B sorting domain-containing protein n=1 Tax=Hymenobacter sp. UYCo722 TaxID=3156335 RepID=UPI003399CB42